MISATCTNCHNELGARGILAPCSECGSLSQAIGSFTVAGLEIFPCIDVRVQNPKYQGRRKYIREVKSVAEHSVDGRLVRKNRLIDRGNNRYREKVTAVDTGEIIRHADHKLSEHTGRGSDKPGLKRN